MPRSAVRPDPIWIRRKDLHDEAVKVTVRFRWNITEVTIPAEMESERERTEFEYDEKELTFAIPLANLDADLDPDTQIDEYIKARIADLLPKAQKRAAIEASPYAEKWRKKAVEAQDSKET